MISQRSGGAGLVVALLMLIIMSMSALALVRVISIGILVAGNFAFRQAAVMAAEAGTEAAIVWLTGRALLPALYTDQPDQGYYASVPDDLDITGTQALGVAIDWDDDDCNMASTQTCMKASRPLAADAAGNVIRYAIHRLCRMAGSPQGGANSCLMAGGSASASSKRSSLSYGASSRFSTSTQVYYRITVRVRGPRNTVVFTQTLAHF